jgi:hypothetical protein
MNKLTNNYEIFHFALLVKEWTASYSFGIATIAHKLRYNSEYEHYEACSYIQLDCVTYQNESRLKALANTKIIVKILFLTNEDIDSRSYNSIGFIQTYKNNDTEITISIAKKDINFLTQILQTNNNLGISFSSNKLRYNKALIKSFDITTNFKPEEF